MAEIIFPHRSHFSINDLGAFTLQAIDFLEELTRAVNTEADSGSDLSEVIALTNSSMTIIGQLHAELEAVKNDGNDTRSIALCR